MRTFVSALATTLLALVSAAASASPARAPAPAAATAAFGRLLHDRYANVRGYWTCPRAQIVNGSIGCLGEVHAGLTRHQTSASASLSAGRVVFSQVDSATWVRHWWPYSRRFIIRSRVNVPGTVSVNSPAYDWGFLAEGARTATRRHPVHVSAYDGDAAGWFRFYLFTCAARHGLITCTNALGDAMRYRPR